MSKETPREYAHRMLDAWLDDKVTDLVPKLESTPQLVNLGYKFAKALTDAKESKES